MAPISLPRAPSGEQIRQISCSISSTISIIPTTTTTTTIQQRSIPENIYTTLHKTIPLIPRTIQHLSNLIPRTPTPHPKRQTQILAIPSTYAGLNDGPAPGSVAGIVIGAVGGFLLVLWLLYTCFNLGGFPGSRSVEVIEEEIVRRRSRSPRRSHTHTHTETVETTSKPRSPVRRDRIVVEETTRVSRPAPHRDDDIVEVIEEHSASTPPRRTSRRSGGFRTVDPAGFGGGDRPMRHVR